MIYKNRMFSKKIIASDIFLELPASTQALYFHLWARADDDGFIDNPISVTMGVGASEDDLKLLIEKIFFIMFDIGAVVIKHWGIHNYIRKTQSIPASCEEFREVLKSCKLQFKICGGRC